MKPFILLGGVTARVEPFNWMDSTSVAPAMELELTGAVSQSGR